MGANGTEWTRGFSGGTTGLRGSLAKGHTQTSQQRVLSGFGFAAAGWQDALHVRPPGRQQRCRFGCSGTFRVEYAAVFPRADARRAAHAAAQGGTTACTTRHKMATIL